MERRHEEDEEGKHHVLGNHQQTSWSYSVIAWSNESIRHIRWRKWEDLAANRVKQGQECYGDHISVQQCDPKQGERP